MKRWWVSPLLPVAAAVAVLAPFARKAFNVDDPLFLWTARQILRDPARFYDFNVNWYGWEMPMAEVLKNPPGVSYYLALVGGLTGWGEVPIHLALLLPASLVAWGTFALARELSADPIVASLATVLTPAFVVSGTNVMSDMSMLAGWIWALGLWVRGVHTKRMGWLVAAGLIGAVAMLTKYFALALVGLFVAYAWCATGRRVGRWIVPALFPVIALASYELWTAAVYNRALFADAASYASKFAAPQVFSQGMTGLVFAGGAALTVLFFAPLLWSRRVLVGLILAVAALLAVVVISGELAGAPIRNASDLRWGLLGQLGVLAFGGAGLLGLAIADFRRSRDAASLLLLLWVLGTFVFACFVNWSINLRIMLPLLPAAGILIARRVESRPQGTRFWLRMLPLAPSVVIALLVGASDQAWANSAREAADRVNAGTESGRQVWFQGHWGFQWYMQEHGYRPFDFKNPRVSQNDVIVLPTNNTNVRGIESRLVTPLPQIDVATHGWLSTMNLELGAGCYSHINAPLPFAFGTTGPERYFIVVARQSIESRPALEEK
jgi:hypothetical protein